MPSDLEETFLAKKASEKVARTMREFARGELRSGGGGKVTSREQAIAIGLSQARRAGYAVPAAAHATRKTAHATRKTPPAQLDREIAEVLGKPSPGGGCGCGHDHATRKKRAAESQEMKDLREAKERLFSALGYAGNTSDQVREYHRRIAEIDVKMRILSK